MDQIKAKSNLKSDGAEKLPGGTHAWDKPLAQFDDSAKVTADVQSAKLKQLLGQIKQS
jgi:hypothetical protein